MIGTTELNRRPVVGTIVALTGVAAVQALLQLPALPVGALAFVAMLTLPGLAIHVLMAHRPRALELPLTSIIYSLVFVAVAGSLLMLAGVSAVNAARTLMALTAVGGGLAAWRLAGLESDFGFNRRHAAALFGAILLFCFAAGYLPLRFEWWRYWSDAWFHIAVIHQITDYGLPPADPYFLGLELQYMWIYHVLVIMLSLPTGIDSLVVMPLVNMFALIGLCMGTYLLAARYRKDPLYGWFSMVSVILSISAVVWAFIPLRIIAAFTGEVRGWDELVRTYSFTAFDQDTVWSILRPYNNQIFLLNKFIVATAFSSALCFMASFWFACASHLAQPRVRYVVLAFASMLGMLTFHSLAGFMMLAGLCGGGFFLAVFRKRSEDLTARPLIELVAASFAALAIAIPYLYSIMHLKESEQLFPLKLMMSKTGGIVISCALVAVLAIYQVRRLWNDRKVVTQFLVFTTIALIIVANLIYLPGPNTYDKLVFFVFFPLAVVGGWTFADRLSTPGASRRRVALVVFLLLMPVNAFAMLGYLNTAQPAWVSDAEVRFSAWVRDNTSRDAVFIDKDERLVLLVHGPRRYYWGRQAYAFQWGYPRQEMKLRRHVRDTLYDGKEMDRLTLDTLAGLPDEVYVIVYGTAAVERYPALFERVYDEGGISLYRVDRDAARQEL